MSIWCDVDWYQSVVLDWNHRDLYMMNKHDISIMCAFHLNDDGENIKCSLRVRDQDRIVVVRRGG